MNLSDRITGPPKEMPYNTPKEMPYNTTKVLIRKSTTFLSYKIEKNITAGCDGYGGDLYPAC